MLISFPQSSVLDLPPSYREWTVLSQLRATIFCSRTLVLHFGELHCLFLARLRSVKTKDSIIIRLRNHVPVTSRVFARYLQKQVVSHECLSAPSPLCSRFLTDSHNVSTNFDEISLALVDTHHRINLYLTFRMTDVKGEELGGLAITLQHANTSSYCSYTLNVTLKISLFLFSVRNNVLYG